jgi:hypothetical protein
VVVVVVIAIVIIRGTTTQQKTVVGPVTNGGKIVAIGYPTQVVDEPFFTMKIPKTWQQTSYINNADQYTISWMDKNQADDTRWLTIYIDKILPNIPINNLLPIKVHGDGFSYSTISDNCTNLVTHAINSQISTASYQGIDFYCNIADIVGEVIGTGSVGSINRTTITGPTSGTHSYFFEYTERSGEPDYSYFDNALTSFRAK